MKTKINGRDLRNLIQAEVRKIVGEDSLMEPPELGDPHYLSQDGPALPMSMGDEYEDEMYVDEPCPGCGQSPCVGLQGSLNEGGCGCGGSKSMKDIKGLSGHPVDKVVSDILTNPVPCPSCGKIHTGSCGSSHHASSYMARPQLAKISKYANKLLEMIDEGEQIQDWQESKIAQMSQMIGDVYHSIEYKKYKGE